MVDAVFVVDGVTDFVQEGLDLSRLRQVIRDLYAEFRPVAVAVRFGVVEPRFAFDEHHAVRQALYSDGVRGAHHSRRVMEAFSSCLRFIRSMISRCFERLFSGIPWVAIACGLPKSSPAGRENPDATRALRPGLRRLRSAIDHPLSMN